MRVAQPVRFGGREIDGRFVFELTGGALALDFVNTLDERRASPKERLTRYDRLVDWALQVGMLTPQHGVSLLAYAKAHSAEATTVLTRAADVRELIFSMLEKLVARSEMPDGLLDAFNRWLVRAARSRRLVGDASGLVWLSAGEAGELEAMLWPIIESAAAIMTSNDLRRRLRLCDGPTCAWAFLDYSRNQNRRWCDMSVCGNRAKVRRHYERQRQRIES